MSSYFTFFDSPLGRIKLISNGKSITGLYFENEKHDVVDVNDAVRDDGVKPFALAKDELRKYFAGELRNFTVPFEFDGTEFQCAVWMELTNIPYGKTISYGEQAKRIGRPKAFRAVGMANGKNPISVIVPCHRVVGADGSLTGYGGGMALKEALLKLESSS